MMIDIFLKVIVLAYAITGIVAIIGYWPTIRDLMHKKRSAALGSYEIWTLTAAITFLYGTFILKDLLASVVMGLNFAACLTIFFLTLNFDRNNKKRR